MLKSYLTPLFISSYDFAANVIYESTQGLCVVITILFSSLTFPLPAKKPNFSSAILETDSALVLPQHLEKMNLYIYSQPLLFRQRVPFETLFEIPDVMNLSNSDCAARYDVTNVDGKIDHNPLEAHTRGTSLPDFSSKIKVSPLDLFTRAL